jgi:pre-mRNA-processing factor 17
MAATSLDNQILLYTATDTLRINSSKRFRGHIVAGYACQPNFSPDERYVSSGDSEGKLTVWEFKTCRIVKRFKAHDGVLMGCEWLPHETSQVVTCSWDGTIKLWD